MVIYLQYFDHFSPSNQRFAHSELFSLSALGAGVEADGPDGGGEPAAGVCQRPHLPRQLHLGQLRL